MATKKCPFCAEKIKAKAIKCRFCGSSLSNLESRPKSLIGLHYIWIVPLAILLSICSCFLVFSSLESSSTSPNTQSYIQRRTISPENRQEEEKLRAGERTTTERQNRTYQSAQQSEWYEGGTLHESTMKEWSRASYQNKLATASDFATLLLKKDGVDVKTLDDIERKIKPMAIELVKALDAANKDGVADDQPVTQMTVAIYVLMKQRNL